MKKQVKLLAIVFLVSIAFVSCKKWFNKDISAAKVELLSPPNYHADSLLSKHFWWSEMEGADEYQLQIVSPSFDSIVQFYLDTVIADNQYEMTLAPGEYEWRVRGVNNGYESLWNTWSFSVTSTQSLNGQNIVVLTPSSDLITNETTQLFSWDKLLGVESYTFKIKNSSGTVIFSKELEETEYTYTFTQEGDFDWSVQGVNDISASLASLNSVSIDTAAPGNVSLTNHLKDTISTYPASFTWTITTDNGSAIKNTFIIASDSLLSNIVLDTVLGLSPFSLTVAPASIGNYYWGIKREDAAGNKSVGILSRKFRIQ